MKITYIGHATLLLEVDGLRILTDPNFDEKLGGFLPRVSAPGIAIDALPPLDFILLTHAHADHLSFRTLAQLPGVPIFAPPAVANWLQRRGFSAVRDVAAGDAITIGRTTIYAEAAIHRGTRYGIDRWRADANMYLMVTNSESVFFAGDTALSPTIVQHVHSKLVGDHRALDVALLPIGYAPKWKVGFRRGHLTSLDALTLFEQLGAKHFIPYHWGTFHHLTSTAFDAINELRAHIQTHTRGSDVRVLDPGQSFELLTESRG